MKQTILITILGLALATPGFAQMGGGGDHGNGGGMGGGGDHGDMGGGGGMGGGGMMNGAGMLTVADDNSVLLSSGHMDAGLAGTSSELFNIGTDGIERWRVTFEDTRPMMVTTEGDLIATTLVEGSIGPGGMGGGMGGGGFGIASASIVALDLVTGVELWTYVPDEPAMLKARISDDGSIVYVTATEFSEMENSPMGQGGDHGLGRAGVTTLHAFDRYGTLLWSLELGEN